MFDSSVRVGAHRAHVCACVYVCVMSRIESTKVFSYAALGKHPSACYWQSTGLTLALWREDGIAKRASKKLKGHLAMPAVI